MSSAPTLPTTLSGVTKPYSGNGRKLGYPTANIASSTKLTDGVYFGWASLGEMSAAPALIFVGTPETVGDTQRRVEVYILDIADKDYYDQRLTINVHEFYRPNQKFDSVDELLVAMAGDERAGREWFTTHPLPSEPGH